MYRPHKNCQQNYLLAERIYIFLNVYLTGSSSPVPCSPALIFLRLVGEVTVFPNHKESPTVAVRSDAYLLNPPLVLKYF